MFYFEFEINQIDDEKVNATRICEKYLETNTSQITTFFNWLWRASSDNIADYKLLLKENNNQNIFTNFSIIGFVCMISLFVINFS